VSSDTNSRRSTWILLGLVVGAVLGVAAKVWFGGPGLDAAVAHVIKPIGTVFLQLIFMVVVPEIEQAVDFGKLHVGEHAQGALVFLQILGPGFFAFVHGAWLILVSECHPAAPAPPTGKAGRPEWSRARWLIWS
jgi:Na+/H+-dicarboxylate symporter